MRLAKAAHSVFLFTGQLIKSSLGDGANGAGSGAGTAINASTLVDLANAAGIANFESHSYVPPDQVRCHPPLGSPTPPKEWQVQASYPACLGVL